MCKQTILMIQKRQIVCTQIEIQIKINYYLNQLSSLSNWKWNEKIKTTRIYFIDI